MNLVFHRNTGDLPHTLGISPGCITVLAAMAVWHAPDAVSRCAALAVGAAGFRTTVLAGLMAFVASIQP